ncbi:tRNA(adenine34) deaminase [Coemansia sp. BCRC 34301]|nr:tRNA(adenine34) deaminase [Coemansia sp. BCRC 34301]
MSVTGNPPSTLDFNDGASAADRQTFMRAALAMAEEAHQSSEVPVGCVFVHDGQIVGRGRNETNITKNGTRHAELVAIDRMLASGFPFAKFPQTTLYVTVEPCIMCASALRQIHIGLVAYGCHNDRFGGCGSVLNVGGDEDLDGSAYRCMSGVFGDEAIFMLRRFYVKENSSAPQPRKKADRKLKTQDLSLSAVTRDDDDDDEEEEIGVL